MTLRVACCLSGIMLAAAWASAGDDVAELEKQRCPKPKRFALVFSFGYAGDLMPKEDPRFDELLGKIKKAGFNVVHCTYTEKRLALCKKHGVQMMVDFLSEGDHHVYKSPDRAKAVAEKLKGEPAVWGYNIWNDPVRKTGEGRRRDIHSVRGWDPTHPAFSGTYRTEGLSHVVNADLLGYYDFHWKRGLGQHFPHLLTFNNAARERDAWFYSWLSVTSGLPGKGNYNRCLWSAHTAIACGQKGILWFLATDMMDQKSLEWTEIGNDILKVHQEIAPLADELARLRTSTAIWSTLVTKTANNDPLPEGKPEAMPPGLDKHGFPKDAWVQPAKGEFLLGAFEDADKRRFAFVANHNAYVDQPIALKFAPGSGVSVFDRKAGAWKPLVQKEAVVELMLGPAGGELLRLEEPGK